MQKNTEIKKLILQIQILLLSVIVIVAAGIFFILNSSFSIDVNANSIVNTSSSSSSISIPTSTSTDNVLMASQGSTTSTSSAGLIIEQPVLDIYSKYISGKEANTTGKNYLKINSIDVEGLVVEGSIDNSEQLLSQGFWKMDGTGNFGISLSEDSKYEIVQTPVIYGHRFDKLPPEKQTFFALDKLNIGDRLEVGYGDKIYYYEVVSSEVIEPTNWEALNPLQYNALKLVTCTPLWTDKQRLVITAKML